MDWIGLTEALAPILMTLLVTLVSWGVYELRKYVKSKTDNQMMWNACDAIGEAATAVVADLQVMVDNLKKDDSFSKADAEEVKKLAIQRTKAILSDRTLRMATRMIGDIDSLISGKVEEQVKMEKHLAGES